MSLLVGVLAAVVGALCLLNLLLTVGVIRRLKEHTTLIEAMNAPPPAMVLSPGERIGAFTAETEDGARLSSDTLATELVVAVFSPGCAACTEQLPRFVQGARRSSAEGRDRVLAVVAGDRDEYTEEIDRLSAVARVVVEKPGEGVSGALKAEAFPSFYRVAPSGEVLASGHRADDVLAPAGV